MVNILNPMLMGPAQGFQQPPAMPAPLAASSRFAGAGQRLRGMLAPEIALPMAGAMMMGRTPGESFGNAFMIGGQAMGEQKMKEEEQRQQNATLAYLQKSRPDLAAAVSAGMPMQMAWQHAFSKGGADGASYSKTPVYMTDDSGNTVLGTIGDDGSFKKIDTGGLSVASGIDKIDAGTKWLLYDKRTGEKVGEQPKEVYQESFDKAAGTEDAKAAADARSSLGTARQTAAQVRAQVDSLKNDPYLPRMLGPVDSRLPNVTADAARVQAKIDQLQGGAFLQAYQMLKGGGQITEIEGVKAEAAMVRMNAAQNEQDFKAALDEFVSAVEEGVRKLEAAARNGNYVPGGSMAPGNRTSSGVQWSVE